jgi:hypothetical protein
MPASGPGLRKIRGRDSGLYAPQPPAIPIAPLHVLPALVPGLGYDDLEIQGGTAASTALEVLLLDADALKPEDRQTLRRNLLQYCERDTQAMVRLHERLTELAATS